MNVEQLSWELMPIIDYKYRARLLNGIDTDINDIIENVISDYEFDNNVKFNREEFDNLKLYFRDSVDEEMYKSFY